MIIIILLQDFNTYGQVLLNLILLFKSWSEAEQIDFLETSMKKR